MDEKNKIKCVEKNKIKCVDVVSNIFIKKTVTAEYDHFMKAIKSQTTLRTFAETEGDGDFFQLFKTEMCGCGCGGSDAEADRIDVIYDARNKLKRAFKAKTGLSLSIGFHERNGFAHDEINGVYFSVDGVHQLTKAGKRCQKNISRKFFVEPVYTFYKEKK